MEFDDSNNLTKLQREKQRMSGVTTQHIDVIKDTFWEERPWILLWHES